MVIYITSSDPRFIIYLGKDKYENEELIKWGFPNDIWFHVDKFSSAHVYLRLPPEITIKTIPKEIMNECLQLVRDGSIEGRKQEKVSICYTPWYNLKKTASMEIGEVGFKDEKEVYHILAARARGSPHSGWPAVAAVLRVRAFMKILSGAPSSPKRERMFFSI